MSETSAWLTVEQRDAPLILSLPHTGIDIPSQYREGLVSLDLARKDADWWIDKLYTFARDLGATFVHTAISRTVIDVNRDPSGTSLYPGQATTELCPTTTFDGEPFYRSGRAPDAAAVAERRKLYFEPYHAALAREIVRLRKRHERIVLYDCHSIRSVIPRLFEGTLPNFNIGTNAGASCASQLTTAVETACRSDQFTSVVNGRFKAGWITRSFGAARQGRSRRPDGACLPRLYARSARCSVGTRLADAVGRNLCVADPEKFERGSRSVPRFRNGKSQ